MRKVYDYNGSDVTTTVASYLRSNRTLYMCDLMMMSSWIWWTGNATWGDTTSTPMCPQYMNFYWSFGDFPVDVKFAQTGPGQVTQLRKYGPTAHSNDIPRNDFATFWPAPMQRDKFDYDIGFTSKTAEVTWFCGNSLVPVAVESADAPWTNVGGINPGYPVSGLFRATTSTAVQVSPGGRVRITCLGGAISVSGGPGSTNFCDGSGIVNTGGGNYVPAGNNGALCGAFADATGEMVAPPFVIANGITKNVPAGAVYLQMGVNDGPVEDNYGFFMVGVDGSGVIASGLYPSWQQGFSAGMFDECPVNIHRAFFNGDPKKGGTLLGTTLMFRGFVRQSETAQDHVKLTLTSLLDLFQEIQIPTQLIQPGNRTTPYVPAGITYTINNMDAVNSTPTVLRFNNSLPSPPADHALQDAYMITGAVTTFTPQNGQPQPPFLRIRDNVTTGGVLYIYLYEPTVIPLDKLANEWVMSDHISGTGWTKQAATIAILTQLPTSNSYGAPGFPSVPLPEIGI